MGWRRRVRSRRLSSESGRAGWAAGHSGVAGCLGRAAWVREIDWALGWNLGHAGAAERVGWDAGHNLVAEGSGGRGRV